MSIELWKQLRALLEEKAPKMGYTVSELINMDTLIDVLERRYIKICLDNPIIFNNPCSEIVLENEDFDYYQGNRIFWYNTEQDKYYLRTGMKIWVTNDPLKGRKLFCTCYSSDDAKMLIEELQDCMCVAGKEIVFYNRGDYWYHIFGNSIRRSTALSQMSDYFCEGPDVKELLSTILRSY